MRSKEDILKENTELKKALIKNNEERKVLQKKVGKNCDELASIFEGEKIEAEEIEREILDEEDRQEHLDDDDELEGGEDIGGIDIQDFEEDDYDDDDERGR